MARIGIGKLILLLGLVIVLLASGCNGETKPAATPTVAQTSTSVPAGASQPGQTDLDMKPIVRDFLANLPKDWGQIASPDVAAAKPFIVDVRQPEEYSKGFIEGAVNIPIRELVRNLQALPTMDKDIVVVCGSGHRSAIGMAALQMLGYKNAKSLAGGMQSWQAAKLPVVTQPVPARPAGAQPKVDAKVQATLDNYLTNILPEGWGLMTLATLTEDRAKKSSLELEEQPDHYVQGPSILVDVDEPDEFTKSTLPQAINIPLRGLPDNLEKIPADTVTLWA